MQKTDDPKPISTGWRLREMDTIQLEAAPEEVTRIYLMMKANQPVPAKELKAAILQHRKYFIPPRPPIKAKSESFSNRFKKSLKQKNHVTK